MTFSTFASPGVSLQGGSGSGGGTPGGSNTQIQYNSSGTFAGASGLTTNGTELTVASGTQTADAPVLNMSQTWNNGATTFTALKFNITDTASAAASLLMDLQVGGSSRFGVLKDGNVYLQGGTSVHFIANSNGGGLACNNAGLNDGTYDAVYSGYGPRFSNSVTIGWAAASTVHAGGGSPDTILTRRAAANLRLGAADAAAPVAQTLSVQSVVAGTTNTAGANLTITGSQGTGTGAGGSIIFQVAPAGSSGTAQNALADALTINSARQIVSGIAGSAATPAYNFSSAGNGLYLSSNSVYLATSGSVVRFGFGTNGAELQSTGVVGWSSSSTDASSAKDLLLFRDAANTLALRNGTNAQKFNVYKTFTDASNYERFAVDTTSSAILLAYEFAGTGISRNVVLRSTSDIFYDGSNHNFRNTVSGGSVTRWVINTSGNFVAGADNTYDIGASGATRPRDLFLGRNLVQVGAYHEMAEMTAPAAPAANGVRIYAVDNGSGKTQLMALFATGAAQQIAIEP